MVLFMFKFLFMELSKFHGSFAFSCLLRGMERRQGRKQ